MFSRNQTAGWQQIVAPSFNDTTRGIRVGSPATITSSVFPRGGWQPLTSQETLTATIAATAVAGDIELGHLTLYYEDLPGQSGRYIDESELITKSVRAVTVSATLASGTTGGWSGAELLTAESDLLRANTDYAVIGISSTLSVGAIGLRAPDWSNARIAVPADSTRPDKYSDYFITLSRESGFPCVPVFNSANRNNVQIDCSADENGLDPLVTLYLVELVMG